MTELVIRDATPADIAAITAIYGREVAEGVATFEQTPPTVESMTARLEAVDRLGAPWLVAENDGQVVAYAYATAYKMRAAYRHTAETSVYVHPDAQRTGVGRALMAAMVERLYDIGIRRLIAAITGESHASIALHAELGFQPAGRLQRVGHKFGRWLDVALMELDLDPMAAPPSGQGLLIVD